MMIVYAVIGVILGLVELITVVLACAYVAQITRKRRREDKGGRVQCGSENDILMFIGNRKRETYSPCT